MGIESEQLVHDYLSRVGDLALQQQLSSGDRMRLVADLRAEIDRQRSAQAAHTPGQVRRIIGTLGTPDELVAEAARAGIRNAPEAPGGAGAPDIPAPRAEGGPHRAGTDEWGPDGGGPDWWRVEPGSFGETGSFGEAGPWGEAGPFGESGPGAFGEFGPGTEVGGFRGGVEIPELLRPPKEEPEPDADEGDEGPDADEAGDGDGDGDGGAVAGGASPQKPRRRLPKLRRSRPAPEAAAAPAAPAAARRGFGHPVLLLAAALLVVGAVMGSLLALAGGWLLAYSSRKLSRAEAKWAALGLPGVVGASALVWLWGRMDGRWGDPIAENGMKDALADTWPLTVRTAAVASAVFLLWRARRK
ncbi:MULTISPECIES: hypothetical protein [unclassified Streptomyces]|uniref:hypothetical protein n=1 Tax=unclassified Streptomyces TaxID=2593676 RepID=UPI000DAB7428|nr:MULTISPECIES: hypothetical protein [unclassified Streptomyces]PZT75752.1 hypothetical protein DNK56_20180 [Streptomyces sp. AC1-42W]PZT80294.1 hypothetical protein DNK55_12505 [Streptomyces sp. AC1-42T]